MIVFKIVVEVGIDTTEDTIYDTSVTADLPGPFKLFNIIFVNPTLSPPVAHRLTHIFSVRVLSLLCVLYVAATVLSW